MATRGRKPTPANLRLVTGTHNTTRHGAMAEVEQATAATVEQFGKPEMPHDLAGDAAWAWWRYIAPAAWLDASREASAIAFCLMWQEYRAKRADFPASKHGQMRAYLSDLGLTDERNLT